MSKRFLMLIVVNWLTLTALQYCVEKNSEAKSSLSGKEHCDQLEMSSRNGSEGIFYLSASRYSLELYLLKKG